MGIEINESCIADPGGSFIGVGAGRFVWDTVSKIDCTSIRSEFGRRYWPVLLKNQNSIMGFSYIMKILSTTQSIGSTLMGYMDSSSSNNYKNAVLVQAYYRNLPSATFVIRAFIFDDIGQADSSPLIPISNSYFDTELRIEATYESGTFQVKVYDDLNNLISDSTAIITPGRTFSPDIWGIGTQNNPETHTMYSEVKNLLASFTPPSVIIKNAVIKNSAVKSA